MLLIQHFQRKPEGASLILFAFYPIFSLMLLENVFYNTKPKSASLCSRSSVSLENVGRILKFLDENGLAQNTVIVYTSDQGFYLGEHGWFDKRYMQKESLNMPLLIRYPNEIKPGSTNKSIIINADFAPTLLDYAGISKPS